MVWSILIDIVWSITDRVANLSTDVVSGLFIRSRWVPCDQALRPWKAKWWRWAAARAPVRGWRSPTRSPAPTHTCTWCRRPACSRRPSPSASCTWTCCSSSLRSGVPLLTWSDNTLPAASLREFYSIPFFLLFILINIQSLIISIYYIIFYSLAQFFRESSKVNRRTCRSISIYYLIVDLKLFLLLSNRIFVRYPAWSSS